MKTASSHTNKIVSPNHEPVAHTVIDGIVDIYTLPGFVFEVIPRQGVTVDLKTTLAALDYLKQNSPDGNCGLLVNRKYSFDSSAKALRLRESITWIPALAYLCHSKPAYIATRCGIALMGKRLENTMIFNDRDTAIAWAQARVALKIIEAKAAENSTTSPLHPHFKEETTKRVACQ